MGLSGYCVSLVWGVSRYGGAPSKYCVISRGTAEIFHMEAVGQVMASWVVIQRCRITSHVRSGRRFENLLRCVSGACSGSGAILHSFDGEFNGFGDGFGFVSLFLRGFRQNMGIRRASVNLAQLPTHHTQLPTVDIQSNDADNGERGVSRELQNLYGSSATQQLFGFCFACASWIAFCASQYFGIISRRWGWGWQRRLSLAFVS